MTADRPSSRWLGAVSVGLAVLLLLVGAVLFVLLQRVSEEYLKPTGDIMRTPFDHPLGIGLVGVTLAQLVPFFIGLRGLVSGASHRGLLMSGVAVAGLLFAGSVFVMVFGSLMAMQY